jgi:hypothetical protein
MWLKIKKTLAYYVICLLSVHYEPICLIVLAPGGNLIKLVLSSQMLAANKLEGLCAASLFSQCTYYIFLSVIYECLQKKTRVFVPGKLFKPSLKFGLRPEPK